MYGLKIAQFLVSPNIFAVKMIFFARYFYFTSFCVRKTIVFHCIRRKKFQKNEFIMWTQVIDILKITLPAATVAFTVWFMLRQYFNSQFQLRRLEIQQQNAVQHTQQTLPMRLQALERLSLLCERIQIPNLILRLRADGAKVNELQAAMLIAIQQEYEHNITQRIYVSDSLWKIIEAARQHVANVVLLAASQVDAKADQSALVKALFELLESQNQDALQTAQMAIRAEASSYFG
jgi:hypothetical protein